MKLKNPKNSLYARDEAKKRFSVLNNKSLTLLGGNHEHSILQAKRGCTSVVNRICPSFFSNMLLASSRK